jgi:hypothetical protein
MERNCCQVRYITINLIITKYVKVYITNINCIILIIILPYSDIGSYSSRHSLLDVANSLKKTGVAIKGCLIYVEQIL